MRRNTKIRLDHLLFAARVASVLFLTFLFGMFGAFAGLPPSGLVGDALVAGDALIDQMKMASETWPKYLWSKSVREERGLTYYDASQAFPGYTVYTSGHGPTVLLIDMEGREVHRWEVPFRRAWPQAKHVSGWIPDRHILIRRARISPNGDLLVLYETHLDSPGGYGLARFDLNGRVLWRCSERAHHDFSVGPDGRIYVLTHEFRKDKRPDFEHLGRPLLEDFVVVLSSEGEPLKTIPVFDVLSKSPLRRFFAFHATPPIGDVTHANTIRVVGEKFASHYEGVSAGDLLVCLRNVNLVFIMNPETESVVWATTGPWYHPHDPDPLENGRLLIFDNYLARGLATGSRVLEFDPGDGAVCWEYAGSKQRPFRSDIRSCQQLLPNGNVLITESDYGRIFEVTREGAIVWEYINPVRGGERGELIPIVCGATRYTAEQLPFLAGKAPSPNQLTQKGESQ